MWRQRRRRTIPRRRWRLPRRVRRDKGVARLLILHTSLALCRLHRLGNLRDLVRRLLGRLSRDNELQRVNDPVQPRLLCTIHNR